MTNLPKITLITGSSDLLVNRALEKVWKSLKSNIKDISKQEIDAKNDDARQEVIYGMGPDSSMRCRPIYLETHI